MIRRPPRSTRTDTLFPYTTLFRSVSNQTWRSPFVGCSSCLPLISLMSGLKIPREDGSAAGVCDHLGRSEEHTSALQSLMRISYAVFCLKKKKQNLHVHITHQLRNKSRDTTDTQNTNTIDLT